MQDFNQVVFTKNDKDMKNKTNKKISQIVPNDEDIKIESSAKLGKLISAARLTQNLNQKDFSIKLGISIMVLSKWESSKIIPTNQEIAKMESILCIKLPRNKKIKLNKVIPADLA